MRPAARPANFLDRLFVFHPDPWIERDWARIGRVPLEEVWFTSEDGTRLFGWYVAARESPAVMLWCHGNAGNMIHRLENLAALYQSGLSVFLFDYRGYGRSEGMPTEKGLYQDARAAYHYLSDIRHIDPARLVAFGRSLGAAVAGNLAGERPVAGLILESAFPSIAVMAKQQFGGLPAHWLLGSRFPLIERLKSIHVPILMVHGDQDTIVPFALGEQVFRAAPEPKSLYVVKGADHNNLTIVGGTPYFARLKQFVESVTKG
jgi:fermentation-respiration switch protein FrsA (DUF1100 family)